MVKELKLHVNTKFSEGQTAKLFHIPEQNYVNEVNSTQAVWHSG